MRVVLATRHIVESFIPLALQYLKASIVHRTALAPEHVAILEFTHAVEADAIADAILAEQPDVVGLSCYVWNVTALLAAAGIVRRRRPAVKIVLGGPEVGPMAADILERHPAIDVVVSAKGNCRSRPSCARGLRETRSRRSPGSA